MSHILTLGMGTIQGGRSGTIPDFAALGEIADELNDVHRPIELETVGTYADFGQDIL